MESLTSVVGVSSGLEGSRRKSQEWVGVGVGVEVGSGRLLADSSGVGEEEARADMTEKIFRLESSSLRG